ncbi:MAG: hypothetical protein KDD76_05660, partial [Rickettsiales bacterium]|nr:hypothetical protein [Rickettsiales bacterium]
LIGPEAEMVVQTQRKLEHENNKVREPSRKNVHSAYQQALKLTPESIETSDPREHLDIYS